MASGGGHVTAVSSYIAYARALNRLGWTPAEFVVAESFAVRLRGMLGRCPVAANGLPLVMAFPRCSSVHTCFMAYPIDIAFIDARDLPMRIGEIAHDFRYESSGTLKGIERGRHFCQNDAHLFCTPEQIKSEVADVCNLIFETYKDFNITDYRCVLSLRDPADKKKYHDDDAMWNHAEQALREVLTELGIHFTEEIGEAAFYGPKLDVNVKPAVGAEYTLSTCQLDFCLPAKFHLTYVDKDGTEKTPVVLHRAILGSLDRFMAYLIEETKGKFPTWLAPTQVKVLPVSEKTLDYAEGVTEKLVEAGVRVVLDDDNQKIGYKIREAQQVDRVPYMLVLGAKEAEAGNISVRDRKGETTTMELDAFIAKVTAEIRNRSL